LLSPAHGRVGARATSLSFPLSVPPPSEKIAGGFQQAGKKKKGSGENEFLPACQSAEGGLWGGNAGRDSIRKILWILLKESSDFVQQTPPLRKNQVFASRFSRAGGLGDNFVGNFRDNLPLSILNGFVKENFNK